MHPVSSPSPTRTCRGLSRLCSGIEDAVAGGCGVVSVDEDVAAEKVVFVRTDPCTRWFVPGGSAPISYSEIRHRLGISPSYSCILDDMDRMDSSPPDGGASAPAPATAQASTTTIRSPAWEPPTASWPRRLERRGSNASVQHDFGYLSISGQRAVTLSSQRTARVAGASTSTGTRSDCLELEVAPLGRIALDRGDRAASNDRSSSPGPAADASLAATLTVSPSAVMTVLGASPTAPT